MTTRSKRRPAPSTAELFTASGLELAAWIRERAITSREVVDAHIAKVDEVNPRLNAVVRERYARARVEADAADARIARGDRDLPPYHGVPCTIKEAFALEGMPQTAGLVARRDVLARDDAVTVARLRDAGAIPIGVTNVSELCMWYESDNRVYGRTNNAYDPSRTAGGSSGGEGAIIGAGASPFGLGADIGGSIRMPSFFNGIFGHKPTGGLVPTSGQFPNAHGAARRILATGPMCRRAEDLMPLLRILAGPDGEDEECTACDLGEPTANVEGLNVLVVEENGAQAVHPELKAAQARAARWLADRGASVRTEKVPLLKCSFDIWSALMSAAGGPTFTEMLFAGRAGVRRLPELARFLTGRSPHTLPAIALALIEELPKWLPGRSKQFCRMGAELRQDIIERIGPGGVMLYPPFARLAPRHRSTLVRPFQFVYCAIVNALELPSTAVPLGLSDEGVPLGVQVVGCPWEDHATIGVAMALETAFGGWVPPAAVTR
jgi:fatty acid amide hydrolase 2